jgi:transcriptional regulator with GAF, ATPase, and Fis domain
VRQFISSQKERFGISRIVGKSKKMRELFEIVKKVLVSGTTTILLQGESGTGKDLLAKCIHFESERSAAPFMNVTCSALPEALLESELFGHERGAFTDAKNEKKGLFELARGGTLYLDEIGDMPLKLQAKLLRFLEERTFKRLGGVRDISVDLRIIASTNQDLEVAVREGRFRSDLYYRLKVIPIDLPPLREKAEDIPLLTKFFVDTFNKEFKKRVRGLTAGAMRKLIAYQWPGNVRELRNMIERAMILGTGDYLSEEDLPFELHGGPVAGSESRGWHFPLPSEGIDFEVLEKDLVRQALAMANGNQTRAARLLGMSRDQIRYRMEKFQLSGNT